MEEYYDKHEDEYDGIVHRDKNGRIVAYTPRIQGWFGEKYEPLYPDHDFSEWDIAGGWTDNDIEKEAYYDTCPVEFLIENANYAECVDDTMPMIRALYKRMPERAIELAEAVVEYKKGDEWRTHLDQC